MQVPVKLSMRKNGTSKSGNGHQKAGKGGICSTHI